MQVRFDEPATGQIQLQVSAALKGLLNRLLSPPTIIIVGESITSPDRAIHFTYTYTPAPLTLSAPSTSTPGVTRYYVITNAPQSGQTGPVFVLSLYSNPDGLSLDDWFSKYIDYDNLLLNAGSFTEETTSSGLDALVLTGAIPPEYSDATGPVADAYIRSADGTRVLIVSESQDDTLALWQYSPTQIREVIQVVVSTLQF